MKIDLHCHTKKIKKGESEQRNVTKELFSEKIKDSDIKIAAITNHNHFDYMQYVEFKEAVKEICQVWPGVELDICGTDDMRWHLVVVVDPEQAKELDNEMNNLTQDKDTESCVFKLNEVYSRLKNIESVYIPHFHKEPAIPDPDLEKLRELVNDDARIFHELPNRKSLGVFANHDYNVIIGSDVKNWNTYEKCTFSELRLPVSSFSQFYLLSKRDAVIINSLLNEKESYKMKASPHSQVDIELTIFQDINIIFGQKGTGKSEILKSLHSGFLQQGLKCELYTGSDKDDSFKTLLDTKDLERDVAKVDADLCINEFEKISNWKESNPTPFLKYLNWYRTKDNNLNKSKMKITEAHTLSMTATNTLETEKDFEQIQDAAKILDEIDTAKYFSLAESEQFKILFENLKRAIQERMVDKLIDMEAIRLVNFSIDKIKAIADKNSDTVSHPSTTGLTEFVQNRIDLQNTISKILENITCKEFSERLFLGELEGKGTVFLNNKYRMLSQGSVRAEFSSKLGIRALKEIKKGIEDVYERAFECNIADSVAKLNESLADSSVSSTREFLGISKEIIKEDGSEYTPSNGEKGILLLQKILDKEADAYFLDEPELGMGNSYIDMNVRPKISALAKRRKVVVVATHNANIAVRTLPYISIYRTHENGVYETYVGNPFVDLLKNLNDNSDTKGWTKESIKTLEGGKEAFYERKRIYESGNN